MNDFQRGMICAASLLERTHGASTYATEILQAAGVRPRDFATMEPYDRQSLKALKKDLQ